MAAVTTVADHFIADIFGIGNREVEVLDFIPVMGIRLRHHGLAPLLIEIPVAGGAAVFCGTVIPIGSCAHSFFAGFYV